MPAPWVPCSAEEVIATYARPASVHDRGAAMCREAQVVSRKDACRLKPTPRGQKTITSFTRETAHPLEQSEYDTLTTTSHGTRAFPRGRAMT